MKVYITGATGFVGINLIGYLAELYKIKTIPRENLNNVVDDLFDSEGILIHLAGKAHDLKKTSNPEEYYQVNFELTKKLYDAFLRSDVKKFIFVSSVKAAADTVDGLLTEDFIPNPQTDYGKSKLSAEQYIQSQPLPIGKVYYILRPCMIHGPGNKGNLNLLYQFVKRGIPYPLASFINKRSFLSIGNFCFIISKLIAGNKVPSGIYNLADDDALSTNQLIAVLAEAIGTRPKLLKIPSQMIKGLAKLGDILRLPLTTERLNKLTENYEVSNSKIKDALGCELPVNTIEGLKITTRSFNENRSL